MKYQTLFFYMRIRRREVLHSNDLLTIETMPSWSDISLALYKEFSEQYLIPTIFRYYLENGEIIDGAHRLSIALYLNLKIQFVIFDLLDANYGRSFFVSRGFDSEYVKIIDSEVVRKIK